MTQGKTKPRAACFKECMQAGSETMGFCRDGMVYFKEDIATAVNKYLLQTALEEVAHHVTGGDGYVAGLPELLDPDDRSHQGLTLAQWPTGETAERTCNESCSPP